MLKIFSGLLAKLDLKVVIREEINFKVLRLIMFGLMKNRLMKFILNAECVC